MRQRIPHPPFSSVSSHVTQLERVYLVLYRNRRTRLTWPRTPKCLQQLTGPETRFSFVNCTTTTVDSPGIRRRKSTTIHTDAQVLEGATGSGNAQRTVSYIEIRELVRWAAATRPGQDTRD